MLIYSTYFVPKFDGSLPMDTVFLYQRSLAVFSEMVGCTTSKELKNREIILSHPPPEVRRSTRVPSTLAHLRAYLNLPEGMGVKQPRNLPAFAHFPRPTTLLVCFALPPPAPRIILRYLRSRPSVPRQSRIRRPSTEPQRDI